MSHSSAELNKIQTSAQAIGRPVKLMEVCGTHTMSAFRSGLRSLLPESVILLSGPGCPVCVTPNTFVDKAVTIAQQPQTIVATFGDMLRVPGSYSSLEKARAQGADIRIVYSPLDALQLAESQPESRIVFLGVGFETTAPTIAWTIKAAKEKGLANYSVLCAHKTMPNAMAALLQGDIQIHGFLCPGHVSVITGAEIYEFITRDYKIPCVVTGFEPGDILQGIGMMLKQLEEKRAQVEIEYHRSVTREGNPEAQALLTEVFDVCDTEWRGVGFIPGSGLKIKASFSAHDAERVFKDLTWPESKEPAGCRCGDILRGVCTPPECPLFRKVCTPANPVGACMVSSEGTCAAYYKYQ